MYEYTDKVVKSLYKNTIQLFDELNYIDSIEYISRCKELYKKLDRNARKGFLSIEAYYYFENTDKKTYQPTQKSVDKWLKEYDPITKYQYDNEVERKASRFAESMLATNGAPKEKKVAMRYWTNMITQYSIEATDIALINSYKANGVKKVIWQTEKDDRVCDTCEKRDGKVYNIDNIPTKTHIGCRCWYTPYVEKSK